MSVCTVLERDFGTGLDFGTGFTHSSPKPKRRKLYLLLLMLYWTIDSIEPAESQVTHFCKYAVL